MAFTDKLHNRGSVSTGYDIEYSMLLNGQHTRGEITQTGGDRKTHTISFWHKRAPRGNWNSDADGGMDETTNDMWGTSSEGDTLRFNGNQLGFFREGESEGRLYTNAKWRDTAAWYHFVVAVDTTQGTAANRMKIYVNGVQQTSFSLSSYPDQNSETKLMQNGQMFSIGAGHSPSTAYNSQGYYAEFIIVDCAAKAATDFGEFNDDGIWVPKEYTGDFNTGDGTNGAHYKFEGTAEGTGSGSTGLDSSGNSNNMNFQNQKGGLVDTPTNNFCVMNIGNQYRRYPCTYDHGSTKVTDNSAGTGGATGTIGLTSGKWYYEIKAADSWTMYGFVDPAHESRINNNTHETVFTVTGYLGGSYVFIADSTSQRNDTSLSGLSHSSSSIYGVALDLDNDEISFYKDGTAATPTGVNIDGLAGKIAIPYIGTRGVVEVNFGGCTSFTISSAASDENGYGTFEHAPPSGYYAICTKNLAEYGG